MSTNTSLWLGRWRLPLFLVVLLVALQVAGLRSVLEYRRAAILDGQVWRVLTGNLAHLGWAHLARDLAGLLLIWALLSRCLDELEWLIVMLCAAAAVGLGLLAFSPSVGWYVGISGVLFGVFAAGALTERHTRPVYAGLLLVTMGGLIAWQWVAGALPDETIALGGGVVPQAHLYGVAGGAVAVLLREKRRAWLARRGEALANRRPPTHASVEP